MDLSSLLNVRAEPRPRERQRAQALAPATGWASCPEVPENLPGEWFLDLRMSRYRLGRSSPRVDPQGMRPSLALEVAPCMAQALLQLAALHHTAMVRSVASSGSPRRASSRRSSRISLIASRRLSAASSFVSPCPLAPGISGQTAQKPPSGADSIIAVNSPLIVPRSLSRPHPARQDHPKPRGSGAWFALRLSSRFMVCRSTRSALESPAATQTDGTTPPAPSTSHWKLS